MTRHLAALALTLGAMLAHAEPPELNLYSARHYRSDEALYADFTRRTGIRINRIEGREQELLERIVNEGENSPADVFITVDAARLAQAEAYGVFAPLDSARLVERIPAHLRSGAWAAFSTRARVIVYNRRALTAADVSRYESLADPKLKGKVCSRSGAHPYNLTLVAALIAHNGEAATEAWARGVVANFARPPRGGDLDQIKAVATGECAVAVSNSYYLARLMAAERVEERNLVKRLGIVWPNQDGYGTHINVSGGGVLKHSKHPAAARAFLDYLASDDAQRYFANANNEWPAVPGVSVDNPDLDAMGRFRADTLPLGSIASHLVAAQKLLDRAGYR